MKTPTPEELLQPIQEGDNVFLKALKRKAQQERQEGNESPSASPKMAKFSEEELDAQFGTKKPVSNSFTQATAAFRKEDVGEPNETEAKIQSTMFQWFHNEHPELRGLLFHVPNGGLRSKVEAARMKGMGVVKGIPDFCFLFSGRAWFFEIKDAKGRATPDQETIHSTFRQHGFLVWIVRDLEHFQKLIKAIMSDDKKNQIFAFGLNRTEYIYKCKVWDFLFKMKHNELVVVEEMTEPETRLKFVETVKEFMSSGHDKEEDFDIYFTPDYEAIYRRNRKQPFEPIEWKGQTYLNEEANVSAEE